MDITIQTISQIAITISLIIAIFQLQFLRKQMKSQHDWNRRITGIEFAVFVDPAVREINVKLEKHLHIWSRSPGEISLSEIQKLASQEYPEIMVDLQFVLGSFLKTTSGIKHGVADERICRDLRGGLLVHYYRFFCRFIEDLRKIRGDQSIYESLEFYAKKWDQNTVSLRKPTG